MSFQSEGLTLSRFTANYFILFVISPECPFDSSYPISFFYSSLYSSLVVCDLWLTFHLAYNSFKTRYYSCSFSFGFISLRKLSASPSSSPSRLLSTTTLAIIQNTLGSLNSSRSLKVGYFSLAASKMVENAKIWHYFRFSTK